MRQAEQSGPRSVEDCVLGVLSGRHARFPQPFPGSPRDRRHFLRICERHAIRYAVADELRACYDQDPEPVRALLESLESDREERHALLLAADAQLCEAGAVLRDRAIPFYLLKGIALVHTLYREAPLRRSFRDIDILIPEEHYRSALDAFRTAGYRLAAHKQDIEALARYNHKLCFVPENRRPFNLDVHFRPIGKKLFEQTSGLITELFHRHAESISINDRPFGAPGRELHLLYLCVHLSLQHHLASLKWLYDILSFSRASGLDWDTLIRMAETCRVRRAVALSLRGAREILGARIPDQALRALRPRREGIVTGCWHASRLAPSNVVAGVHHYKQARLEGKAARMFSEILLIDRTADRWRSIGRWVFPPPMFFRASYGAKSTWRIALAYVIHPLVVPAMAVAVLFLTVRYAVERRRGVRLRSEASSVDRRAMEDETKSQAKPGPPDHDVA